MTCFSGYASIPNKIYKGIHVSSSNKIATEKLEHVKSVEVGTVYEAIVYSHCWVLYIFAKHPKSEGWNIVISVQLC